MKIVFSSRPLLSGSKTRGVGVYTRELVSALQKDFSRDSFSVTDGNVYKSGADLVHFPYFDPYFLTLPYKKPIPTVVTIHDVIPLRFPEHFPAGYRGKLKFILQKKSLTNVAHILTDSSSSKADIITYLGIASSQITVVPLAGSLVRATKTIEDEIAREYNLPSKYLLYVGDINWNKNVTGLIEAFSRLNQKSLHLVLVGKVFADKPNIPEYRAVMSKVSHADLHDRVHLLGYVPTHHLPYIYRHATLYIQPSWYEGFGLPVLEAMREGCPVLSSGNGSLREVGGEAVSYFDPSDMSSFVESIKSLLAKPSERKRISELGLARAKEFSWEKTAQLTYEVYEKILASNSL